MHSTHISLFSMIILATNKHGGGAIDNKGHPHGNLSRNSDGCHDLKFVPGVVLECEFTIIPSGLSLYPYLLEVFRQFLAKQLVDTFGIGLIDERAARI